MSDSTPSEITIQEVARLRAIIKQAIWDLEGGRPDMALVCLSYSSVGKEMTELVEIIENERSPIKLEHLLAARIMMLLKENAALRIEERGAKIAATDAIKLCHTMEEMIVKLRMELKEQQEEFERERQRREDSL